MRIKFLVNQQKKFLSRYTIRFCSYLSHDKVYTFIISATGDNALINRNDEHIYYTGSFAKDGTHYVLDIVDLGGMNIPVLPMVKAAFREELQKLVDDVDITHYQGALQGLMRDWKHDKDIQPTL